MLEHRVKQIIAEFSGRTVSEIENSNHYVNDLNLDSLDIIELIIAIEKEFNVVIENAEEVSTVELTIALLEKQSGNI